MSESAASPGSRFGPNMIKAALAMAALSVAAMLLSDGPLPGEAFWWGGLALFCAFLLGVAGLVVVGVRAATRAVR